VSAAREPPMLNGASMTAPLAVFRADGGALVGGGHLVRCQALAATLRERGWAVRFACPEGMDATGLVSPGELLRLADGTDEPAALRTALPGGCDLLVVDHYGWSAALEAACRPWAAHVAAIDDLANRRHDAGLLLDTTLGRTAADYAGLVPPGCILLTGTEFALLRPEFRALRPAALERRRKAAAIGRVLVSCGYWDAADVTGLALDALRQVGADLAVDIVLGPGAPHLGRIAEAVAAAGPGWRLHVGPAGIAGLVAAADLAIGTAGTSSWERCCLGLPAIVLIAADNQAEVAATLARAGAAIDLGYLRERGETAQSVASAIAGLRAAPERIAAMSLASAAICDGLGSDRVADALAALAAPAGAARAGPAVALREAGIADARILFDWRTDPLTAAMSRGPAPTWDEHLAWLERRLGRPEPKFYIAELDGEAAGSIRVDGGAVSYTVAPTMRGRGVATAMLRIVFAMHGPLEAHVKPGNPASAAAARKAGHHVVFIEG